MDEDVIHRIDALVDEEHRLHTSTEGNPVGEADQKRLRDLEVLLDQCWDLLRQRRARRTAGQDPDVATPRPPEVVERYQQ